VKILRHGVLTFANKFGIIFNCDIEGVVMSRTIAGVFDFPGLGFGEAGVVHSSFRCMTIPCDKAGRGLKPAGGPLE
jgi:hypothetical protein